MDILVIISTYPLYLSALFLAFKTVLLQVALDCVHGYPCVCDIMCARHCMLLTLLFK